MPPAVAICKCILAWLFAVVEVGAAATIRALFGSVATHTTASGGAALHIGGLAAAAIAGG